jgi:predicted RNA-binding Zn ribbon-like protein
MDTSLTLGHHSDEAADEGRHGHQASLADGLDFVNTLSYDKDVTNERLTDAPTAVSWLQSHALLHQEMADAILAEASDPEGEERLLTRVRRVRAALRDLLDAAVVKRPPSAGALKEVNRALRAPYVIELVPAADGVSLDHRHDGDPISGAMARLSEAVTRELTGDNSRRLRVCANDDCRWVFNDHSPAGRRKWCDMSSCGNRAKAARHRERQKMKAASESEPLSN